VTAIAQMLAPPAPPKIGVAVCLSTLGGYRLWRHRHPRYAGMQVGFRDLTFWSFLMASAHGAGVMLLPFVMTMPADVMASTHAHMHHATSTTAIPNTGSAALAIHTLAYFATMAFAAHLVYRRFGLSLLRRAWINLDWIWAGALMVTGVVVLVS
jgi:hypothetical protein